MAVNRLNALGECALEVQTASAKSFPGQYYDAETGLNYNYFRSYNPATGRYTQSDPIGLEGGLLTYTYAYEDPNFYTDPYGLYNPERATSSNRGSMFNPPKRPRRDIPKLPPPFGPLCGPEGKLSARWIPDGPMADACKAHDECYSTCGSRKVDCDVEFWMGTNTVYFLAVLVSPTGHEQYKKAQDEAGCNDLTCKVAEPQYAYSD